MKTVLPLLLFVLCMGMKPTFVSDKLVGKWEGHENGKPDEKGIIIFSEDNTMMFISEGDTFGGSRFFMEELDTYCKLVYVTDYSTTPHRLDMQMIDLGSGDVLSNTYCIFEFQGAILRFCLENELGKYPEKFDDETVELKRIK